MDHATLIAILSVWKDDITSITSTHKGKAPSSEPIPDNQLAFQELEKLLEVLPAELEQLAQDHVLASSIARAVQTDDKAIRAVLEEETQAQRDRQVALRLSGGAAPIATKPKDHTKQDDSLLPESELAKLNAAFSKLDIPDFDFPEDDGAPGPSVPYKDRQKQLADHFATKKTECELCTEETFEHHIFTCPCDDRYCKTCIAQLFLNATKDESFFPPRCCKQPLPTEKVLDPTNGFLSQDQIDAFRASAEEFTTKDRVYCHNVECGKFVSPRNVRDGNRAVCEGCGKVTCAICKKEAHTGFDCPEDNSLKELQAVAAASGWRACGGCKRMVELTFGCDHIT